MSLEKGVHLIPSRTQKLSPSSPMILGDSPGKVGRRQHGAFFDKCATNRVSRTIINPAFAGYFPCSDYENRQKPRCLLRSSGAGMELFLYKINPLGPPYQGEV